MGDREELESLRRLNELEKRAAPAASYTPPTRPDIGAPPTGISIDTWRSMPPEQRAAMKDQESRPWGSGIPKMAYDVGGTVTDKTGSPAAGYAANVATQALPALLSSYRIVGAPEQSLLQKPAEALMRKAIKPSTTEDPTKVTQAIKTALEEGLDPRYGSMQKAAGISSSMDDDVSALLQGSSKEVSVPSIGSRLRDLHMQKLKQANPTADLDAIRGEWDALRNHPLVEGKTEIPVQLAHELKKGTYSSLGSKQYGEMGSASTEAQKQLARGMREVTMEAEPAIVEPLKRQASIQNWREIVGNAAAREGNKDLLGISVAAGSPQTMAASMLDRLGIAKSLAARSLYTAGKPSVALPINIAVDEKLQTDKQRMAEYLRKRAQE